MKTYSRVQRGMVFWFNPSKVYGKFSDYIGFNSRQYRSNVQSGNRPWLVVSNNEGNSSAPTCNIVPITLEDKTNLPVHVIFYYEGKRQTILCEQMRTVDIMALSEYIYTVSDEIMEDVEKALQIQYSLRPKFTYADYQLESVVDNLEKIVSAIIEHRTKHIAEELPDKPQPVPMEQIEDAAIKLGQMIEDLTQPTQKVEQPTKHIQKPVQVQQPQVKTEPKPAATPIKVETPKVSQPTKPMSQMSQTEKFQARLQKSQQLQRPQATASVIDKAVSNSIGKSDVALDEASKPKRNTWTIESRKEYLRDCDSMTPEQVMKKYNFSKIQSVFQTKYLHKNYLANQGITI